MEELIVLYDLSKDESCNPQTEYSEFMKLIKSSTSNKIVKDDVEIKVVFNEATISSDILHKIDIAIFACPEKKFSLDELNALIAFVTDKSGKLIILMGEGGEKLRSTNINFLLEEFGIYINSDTVIRSVPVHEISSNSQVENTGPSPSLSKLINDGENAKILHPKECLIQFGIRDKVLYDSVFKMYNNGKDHENDLEYHIFGKFKLPLIYANGATMNVQQPALPILITDAQCFPFNRALAAIYENQSGSKIFACGSSAMFSNTYLNATESILDKNIPCANEAFLRHIILWLGGKTKEIPFFELNANSDIDLAEPSHVFNTLSTCQIPKPCFEFQRTHIEDFMSLFQTDISPITTENQYMQSTKLNEELNCTYKHESSVKGYTPQNLTLINPTMQIMKPNLQPSIHPPILDIAQNDVKLELFNVDYEFLPPREKLLEISKIYLDTTKASSKEKVLAYIYRVMNIFNAKTNSITDFLFNITITILNKNNLEK